MKLKLRLLSCLMYFSTFMPRHKYFLTLVKNIPNHYVKNIMLNLIDPNSIRKLRRIDHKYKLIKVKILNSILMLDLNDHIGFRTYVNGKFDDTVINIGNELSINHQDLILDIGAHVGTVGIPFAKYFGCELIAIEGSYKNASLLLLNLELNQIKSRVYVECLNDAQKKNSYFTKIYYQSGNSGATSVHKNWNVSKQESQFQYSHSIILDKLIDDETLSRIKIIKLDVEGSELKVIRGFTKIKKYQGVLVFEYRPSLMNKLSKNSAVALIKEINRNFLIFGIEFEKNNLILSKFDPRKSQENCIALPKKRINYYRNKFDFKPQLAC
jgi:FkbM family methyltransferase